METASPGTDRPQHQGQFALRTAAETGIRFVPSVTDDYRYNFIADPYIYNGGGVAVLDVNNDGLQDLFFTARLQGCRLYLNQGHFKFTDISESSGVAQAIGLKTGATVCDINADGWADIYVCRTWLEPLPERRNLLYINNQNNTFSEAAAQYGLDDMSASQHANFLDYDRDGDLDCYIVNQPVEFKKMNDLDYTAGAAAAQPPRNAYESDRLLRNDGARFTDVSQAAGIHNRAFGLSSLAGDFNDDGWPDLFVGNDFVMPDFLYLNDQKGHFQEKNSQFFPHSSNHTMGCDRADLNRDGWPDLVALDMLAEQWPRRQRLMSTMQLERDRRMRQLGYGHQAMHNVLQIMSPEGAADVAWLAGMAATDWSWSPLLADFDHDGHCDIFLTSGIKRDLNDLDFFLYTADSINRTGGINQKRFADFEDFARMLPSEPSHPYLFQNFGDLRFADRSAAWGLTQRGFSTGAACADLDNDGDIDLITNNLEAEPSIFENKTIGSIPNHWLQIKCRGTAQNPTGIGAKVWVYGPAHELLFSGEMTSVRGFYSCSEAIFQVGLGGIAELSSVEIQWAEGHCQVLSGPKADQRLVLDIAQARAGRLAARKPDPPILTLESSALGLDFRHRENDFEDFDREKLLPYRLSRTGPCLAASDLNGDGREDVFVGGAAGQAGAIFIQNADETFQNIPQPALAQDAASEDAGCAFLDADGDGDADLFVVSGGNEYAPGAAEYRHRLYLNDGRGRLTRSANGPTMAFGGTCALAMDANGDGRSDLWVGGGVVPGQYPKVQPSVLLINLGNGIFEDKTADLAADFKQIGQVKDLLLADLTGDGQPELVVVGHWMPISILAWEGGVWRNKTSDFGLSDTPGWWNCAAAADLDADGDLDLVAGNEGLNQRLRPPLRLFSADFDGNGSVDPILCVADAGRYRPVAQRDGLAAQMPMMKKKFSRHAAYAQAAITDIFTETELLAGSILPANIFETMWFENKNGKFIAHDLPKIAQAAPVKRIWAADFRATGGVDLFLVGNEYGSQVETYQQDASRGVLLARRADGTWLPQATPPLTGEFRSGVLIQGQNGNKRLILGQNNGPIQVLRTDKD